MKQELRNGLIKLLESLPNGATNGSFNWTDGAFNYSVSAISTNGQWQLYVSEYLVLPIQAPEAISLPDDMPF